MFSQCNITNSCSTSTDFSMREITGCWVSREGAPAIRIYRNISRKGGGIRLCITYNNPQVVCDCTVYNVFGLHYIELYERIAITYDREQEVLHLFAFGEYVRQEN
ncbi:DUF3876 domain-containing protein [Dysgonomonas sp. HGC4]|uniref:DUF3876 domain-containing protein n=1 Tax=Dysgonomonas sp. HGC4 TaxID=1658009 RepID=UPI0009E1CBFE|nr:DUF3876 domain-containing protein [Dysgonomonas sp. HGC4]MBD8347803.1 DUF3876 domain-containing protein [Dysgonomonas sp. HGC4]